MPDPLLDLFVIGLARDPLGREVKLTKLTDTRLASSTLTSTLWRIPTQYDTMSQITGLIINMRLINMLSNC